MHQSNALCPFGCFGVEADEITSSETFRDIRLMVLLRGLDVTWTGAGKTFLLHTVLALNPNVECIKLCWQQNSQTLTGSTCFLNNSTVPRCSAL